jgi:hypothetical protein
MLACSNAPHSSENSFLGSTLEQQASHQATAAGKVATLSSLLALIDQPLAIYLLIDPMLGEPLPGMPPADGADFELARAAAWQRDVVTVELHSSVGLARWLHPYLVSIHGLDDPLLELSLGLAQGEREDRLTDGVVGEGRAAYRIAGWLQTSMHMAPLARQLSAMCRVNTEAYTAATYLRIVDRRVLAMLRYAAGDMRVSAQFGRLYSWTYLDSFGYFATLRSSSETSTRLRLDSSEWRLLETGAAIHRTIRQWLGEVDRQRLPEDINEGGLFQRAGHALDEARILANQHPDCFQELHDLTACAVLSMTNPGLWQVDGIQKLMTRGREQDKTPHRIVHMVNEIRDCIQTHITS